MTAKLKSSSGKEQTNNDHHYSRHASLIWTTIKAIALIHIPILVWLPKYDWRQNYLVDLYSAFCSSLVLIPQSLAFSQLANLSLQYGLFSACFPPFVHAMFTTAPVSSYGPTSIVTVVQAPWRTPFVQQKYPIEDWIATVSFTVGLYYLVCYAFRLGVYILVFRTPFMNAFSIGCCCHTYIKCLQGLIGVQVESSFGVFGLVHNVEKLIQVSADASVHAMAISAVSIVLLLVNDLYLRPFVLKRFKVVFPMECLLIILSTILSYTCNFKEMGIPLVNKVWSGYPQFHPPNFQIFPYTITPSVFIGSVAYAMSSSISLSFNRGVDLDQEILALAAASLVCCPIQCFSVGNSYKRTSVVEAVQIRSSLATIQASIVVLIATFCTGPCLQYLPNCVLSSIVFAHASEIVIRCARTAIPLIRTSYETGITCAITFVLTAAFDIEYGLLMGFALTLKQILLEAGFGNFRTSQLTNDEKTSTEKAGSSRKYFNRES